MQGEGGRGRPPSCQPAPRLPTCDPMSPSKHGAMHRRQTTVRLEVEAGAWSNCAVDFRLLGPLEVDGVEGPIRIDRGKPLALLGLLLIQANHVVPTERI